MKADDKQIIRASEDIAERLRKLLADIRPAIQGKYQLSGQYLDVAITRGMGLVAIECAKVADIPTGEQ
jgi:hypothetical protein